MKKVHEDNLNEEDEKPLVENEALKNTDDVNHDKRPPEVTGDEDLPGYPHYPPTEDILNPSVDLERVDIDVEKITRAGNISESDLSGVASVAPLNDMEEPVNDDMDEEDDIGIVPGTEADVTKEDLLLLGAIDKDMDMGEDEELENKGFRLSLTGDDLDVPGEELDDDNELIGEEDEENNYYSLGGDNKESLEEDAARDE